MKAISLLILGLSVTLITSVVFADGYNPGGWVRVLSCDNGAAIVDNAPAPDRGYTHTAEQIVIHDINIVRYFNQAGVAHSGMLNTEWIGSGVTSDEWGSAKVYSFGIFTGDQEYGNYKPSFVRYNGTGLYVEVHNAVTNGSANWYFRGCTKQ